MLSRILLNQSFGSRLEDIDQIRFNIGLQMQFDTIFPTQINGAPKEIRNLLLNTHDFQKERGLRLAKCGQQIRI